MKNTRKWINRTNEKRQTGRGRNNEKETVEEGERR